MARLAAIEKILYYPTQDRVVENLLRTIHPKHTSKGILFDPCCGEGTAAAALATAWGMESVGIEIDTGRFETAKTKMNHCFLGSIHQVHGKLKASVLFLNPPYDTGEKGRQEIEFLRIASTFLAPEGLLIYIVPKKILEEWPLHSILRKHYNNITVVKYPEAEESQFNQCVVLAKKDRKNEFKRDDSLYSLDKYWWKDFDKLDYRVSPPEGALNDFKLMSWDPEVERPSVERRTGAFATDAWELLTQQHKVATERPLIKPRTGHRALMFVSGALNGMGLDGRIIKGRSVKTEVEVGRKDVEKERDKEIVTMREQIDSVVSEIDLQTGEFFRWTASENPERTRKWFEDHGEALAKAMETAFTPRFEGDLSGYDFSPFRAPGILPGQKEAKFLEIQKQVAAAISMYWRTEKSIILSGEMGTGKTTMALLSLGLNNVEKTVVICPKQIVNKWKREADNLFGKPGTARIAWSFADIDSFFSRPDQWIRALTGEVEPRVLIISKETAKLGTRWSNQVAYRRRHKMAWTDEGHRLVEHKSSHCPRCGLELDVDLLQELREKKNKQECPDCHEALWQVEPLTAKGTKRWPLAKYLRQKYNQYTLIVDECHAYSKSDTDQSRAIQVLVSGAKKLLWLTGTLYSGRASSLFHLLYKASPKFRKLYGFDDAKKFSMQHGLYERSFKQDKRTSFYGYRKKNTGTLKEQAGLNPSMINLLLHNTIFVKLSDLGLDLPPYREIVEVIPNDPEVTRQTAKLQDSLKAVLKKHPKMLGAYLMSCLGYPDCPERGEEIRTEEGEIIGTAEVIEREFLPKDERLLSIALEDKATDRKTLVYFTQTDKRSPIPRVRRYLESHGLRVEHLPADVAPEHREAWLLERKDKFDVLLTNGRLVETGLDLIYLPTVVQYGVEYSINTLRQSIRRSWRLGQDKEVRVYFLAYAGSLQETAMGLISKKMRAAQLLDGDDEMSGLSQHEGETDFLLELAREALKK